MAIPFLSDIKLNGNQIKDLVVGHHTGSQPTTGYHGQIIFRTDQNKIYVNTSTTLNSPSWEGITGDITGITSATTGQLTVASSTGPVPALTIVTGAVADSGTALATGDQIHTFVTTQTDAMAASTTGSAATLTTTRNIAATGDIAWNVDFNGSAAVTAAATIQANAVEGSMLNTNVISGQTDLPSGIATADEILISDGGVLKKTGVDVLATYMQNTLTFTTNTNTGVDMTEGTLRTKLTAITENVTIGDATDVVVTTAGDLVVTGDLTISGDTVTANVATLDVEDKNITVNKSSGDSSSTANGAGLTIQDAVDASTDATILWDATNDEFDFSHAINITGNISVSGSVDGIADLAGAVNANTAKVTNVTTNLGVTTSSTTLVVTSSDGTNATLPVATTSAGGVMSAALFDTLAAAQTSANVTTAIDNNHAAKNKSWVLNNTTSGVASSDDITYTITHGFSGTASRLYKVEVIESSGNGQTVHVDTKRPNNTTIVIVFGSAVTAGDYTALVTKVD